MEKIIRVKNCKECIYLRSLKLGFPVCTSSSKVGMDIHYADCYKRIEILTWKIK